MEGYQGVNVSSSGKKLEVINESLISFSVNSGLCGMGELTVYNQNNGSWIIMSGGLGNGSIQGTCNPKLGQASSTCSITVPFRSIHQSHVTGLPKLTKCHVSHGHFGEVTKSFGDHVPNIENFCCLRRQPGKIFVYVTANLGGWQNHIFIRCVTRHGAW